MKEANEIQNVKKSAKLTCYLQNKIIEHVENIIDEELNEKHSSISQKIGNFTKNQRYILIKYVNSNHNFRITAARRVLEEDLGEEVRAGLFAAGRLLLAHHPVRGSLRCTSSG